MQRKPRLNRRDWARIALQTLGITMIAVSVSLLGAHLILSTFSAGLNLTGIFATIALPIVLGGPTTLGFAIQNARLREAYRRLEAAAARDSLTACLNHGAFIAQANEFLNGTPHGQIRGALLVVDADYFKSVNDRYGHHIGDAALRQIAARIQGAVRQCDLVGRLGGEEFGVFLPGATQAIAESIAETIRRTVQTIEFEVEGNRFSLSVSVGGAVFESPVDYGELFRSADKKLYKVKNSGRNNVALMHLPVPGLDDSLLLKAG
ncbi:GGDEF domain-containing protein [Pelagibacterium sediminicola]|uniref:GGDEF domain-containing protein n=1 Tax=Pelagibacterium sediminicola TaxID=2248761 RepID=UPI0013008976|nr:GGDEF domain-containing protein [Pelagibacterium sediminicola]